MHTFLLHKVFIMLWNILAARQQVQILHLRTELQLIGIMIGDELGKFTGVHNMVVQLVVVLLLFPSHSHRSNDFWAVATVSSH